MREFVGRPSSVASSSSPRIQAATSQPLQRITSADRGGPDAFENAVNIDVQIDGMLAGQFLAVVS